jgi:hypothetical protein
MEPCYVLWRKQQRVCPGDIHLGLPEQGAGGRVCFHMARKALKTNEPET